MPSFNYGGFVVEEALREAFHPGQRIEACWPHGHPILRRHVSSLRLPVGVYTFPIYDRRSLANVVFPVCSVGWYIAENDEFEPVKHIATVRGKARYLLLGEHVALNLLARCSGIATTCVFERSFRREYRLIQRVAAPSTSGTWRRPMVSVG
jgi:nicotinate-nucleotide pyrophosphorylase (carboxylating)